MSISSEPKESEQPVATRPSGDPPRDDTQDRQVARWGGRAGVAGAALLVASGVVVGAFGLPDASDVETLTDFGDNEVGRNIEHFLYLGSVMLFSLHVFVLHRLLRTAHQAAALFGTVVASFGLVIMAASSLLHVSTSPLDELYRDATTPDDVRAVEYAWHGAQSVFDTMLATGVLLVPIGILLFGIAMRHSAGFGSRLAIASIGLGTVGFIGGVIAVIVPGSMISALSVLAIAVFHLSAGWRTMQLGHPETTESLPGGG